MDIISKQSIDMYKKIMGTLSPTKARSAILTALGMLLGAILSKFHTMYSSKATENKIIKNLQEERDELQEQLSTSKVVELVNDRDIIKADYNSLKKELDKEKETVKKLQEESAGFETSRQMLQTSLNIRDKTIEELEEKISTLQAKQTPEEKST